MVVSAKNVEKVELMADAELAENVLDNLSPKEMAEVFNDERILSSGWAATESNWNGRMIKCLNENGRKHIKELYDLVCKWYEENPEDAEAEGYTEW